MNSIKEAICYLLAIIGAGVVALFYAPLWGILSYILVMIAIIVRLSLVDKYSHERLFLPLALVPLLRVTSIGMSLLYIPRVVSDHLSYAPLLIAAIVVVQVLRYNNYDIGLNSRWLGMQILVGATGILLGWAVYILLRPEPIVADFTRHDVWLPALTLLMFTGFAAEFLFRGVIQKGVVEAFGAWGIVYVSLMFAALYIQFLPAVEGISIAFIISLFFCWIVKVTGSILGVALAHSIYNITLYLIFPLFF